MKLGCVSEADGGKAAKTEGKARSTVVKEITAIYISTTSRTYGVGTHHAMKWSKVEDK